MTDLTEYTWYYCKMKDGDIQMLERGSDYFLSGDVPLLNNEVKEVLAPVPSYEEWQEKLKENAQLKELLKEVLRHELSLKEISELTRKICQALGEDK